MYWHVHCFVHNPMSVFVLQASRWSVISWQKGRRNSIAWLRATVSQRIVQMHCS